MNIKSTACIYVLILLFWACTDVVNNHKGMDNIDIGNQFIDAFYSFNRDSLQSILSSAQKSHPELFYYQEWAECANYKILDRSHFFEKNDSMVIFPVTVKDDMMDALEIDFNVTDTFHITVQNGKILSVETSSNDVDTYYQAKEWVYKNKPELVEKPCEGIWQGGPTPCECVLGMIEGFRAFIKAQRQTK